MWCRVKNKRQMFSYCESIHMYMRYNHKKSGGICSRALPLKVRTTYHTSTDNAFTRYLSTHDSFHRLHPPLKIVPTNNCNKKPEAHLQSSCANYDSNGSFQ